MDHLPLFGKRELICLLVFTCNYVVSVGEVFSSSGCLGWATLFYCGTPGAINIIVQCFSYKSLIPGLTWLPTNVYWVNAL